VDVSDPVAFAVVAEEDLGYCEGDEFTVGEVWSSAASGSGRDDVVVDQDVK
jgi:hypothetical protein